MRYLMIAAALVGTLFTVGTAEASPYRGYARRAPVVSVGPRGYVGGRGVYVGAPAVYAPAPVWGTPVVYGRGLYRPGYRHFHRW